MITADIIRIEGLAMAGMIKDAAVEECRKPRGWRKIRAVTIDGEVLETPCLEPEAIKRNLMVLKLYIKRWGSLVNLGGEVEGPPEE